MEALRLPLVRAGEPGLGAWDFATTVCLLDRPAAGGGSLKPGSVTFLPTNTDPLEHNKEQLVSPFHV